MPPLLLQFRVVLTSHDFTIHAFIQHLTGQLKKISYFEDAWSHYTCLPNSKIPSVDTPVQIRTGEAAYID